MMIECPRCGFTQPKDRFCANCGLDIENFHPTKPTWHQALVKNPYFHLGLAVFVILVTVFYIQMKQDSEIRSPYQDVVEEHQQAQADPEPPPTKPTPKAVAEKPKAKAPPPKKIKNTPAFVKTKAFVEEPPAKEKKKLNFKVPTSLYIRFAEIDQNYLEHILNGGTSQGSGANYRSASYKSSEGMTGLSKGGSVQFLPGTRTQRISLNEGASLNFTSSADNDESHGMTVQLTPTTNSAEAVRFDLRFDVNLRGRTDGDLVASSGSGSFEIPKGEILVIAGVVPHVPVSEEQMSSLSGTPLIVVASPGFIDNSVDNPTEFAIIIQPQ